MTADMRVSVKKAGGRWQVAVTTGAGEVRRYHFLSKRQARYFAAVFRLGPTFLPATELFPAVGGGPPGESGWRGVGT